MGGVGSLAWLIRAAWLDLRLSPPGGWLTWVGMVTLLGVGVAWSALVVAGGFIGLHRDTLEQRGVPYAPDGPREWIAGPAVRTLRRMI